ncbi:integrase [Rhodobacterales bacterium 52_120_T64]|nr:integrase [Rhodobacterales bacterium 52_120_T64]
MPQDTTKRARNQLTAAFVRTVTKPGKYHDGGGTGLYLRVDHDGGRYWVQRTTINRKRCEIGLGSPPVVTLAMAREQAVDNKRLIRSGLDPLAEKRKAQAAVTFAEAVEKYLVVKLKEFQNEKHRKQWRATLDKYATPVIGSMYVQSIEVRDVLKVLQPIWQDKTETATRVRGRIEAVLSWATVTELRKGDNPARWKGNLSEILPKPSKISKAGHHPALALKDVSGWWSCLETREGMATKALQFACLTAARSGEVRGMTWAEVDLEATLWTIPADRMKAGREHRVPLPNEGAELLRDLPRLNSSPYVFFAPQGGMLSDMSISAVMRRIQASEEKDGRDGFIDPRSGRPAVPHGLRSTFRDWAAEQGYDHVLAELALAHTVGSAVERAYRRTDLLERRRQMLEDWVSFVHGN